MKKVLSLLIAFLWIFCVNAQQTDSLRSNKPLRFTPVQLVVPVGAMAAGTALIFTEKKPANINTGKHLGFGSYAEDYIQYSPLMANTIFDLAGMKSRTDRVNKLAIGIKTGLIVLGSVSALKYTTHRWRPDGSNHLSYPSGHTATAFAGATALSTEYRDNYPWVPYAAYTVAGGVGALRVIHNKHYLSDVIVGAGLGILSSKIAYWTHQYRWKTKRQNDIFSGVLYSK